MTTVRIRRIRADEGPRLRALRLRALADAPLAFGSTLAREQAYSDDLWRERAERGALGVDSVTFVAERDGHWLGMVTGLPRDSDVPNDPRPELVAMFVSPEARGGGLGAALVDAVLSWARDRKAGGLTLWVTASNEAAIALYEGLGFRPTGDRRPLDHASAGGARAWRRAGRARGAGSPFFVAAVVIGASGCLLVPVPAPVAGPPVIVAPGPDPCSCHGRSTVPIGRITAEAMGGLADGFHLLHRKDRSRIVEKRFCLAEDVEVAWKDIVKGYEYARDRYVVVTEEDFARVRVPATQTFEICRFVPAADVENQYFNDPYYVTPQGKSAVKAYTLLRDALRAAGKPAIGTIVLRQREHLAARETRRAPRRRRCEGTNALQRCDRDSRRGVRERGCSRSAP